MSSFPRNLEGTPSEHTAFYFAILQSAVILIFQPLLLWHVPSPQCSDPWKNFKDPPFMPHFLKCHCDVPWCESSCPSQSWAFGVWPSNTATQALQPWDSFYYLFSFTLFLPSAICFCFLDSAVRFPKLNFSFFSLIFCLLAFLVCSAFWEIP